MSQAVAVPADFTAQVQALSNALERAGETFRHAQAVVQRAVRRTRKGAHKLLITELRNLEAPAELVPVIQAEVWRCSRERDHDPHTQLHHAPVLSSCHASRPPCTVRNAQPMETVPN